MVLHERRSGFDRRAPCRGGLSSGFEGALVCLRDRPRLLRMVLIVVNILNLADFLLTLNVLANGGGEANPVMRSLFNADPLWAGLFKFLAILAVTLLMWRCRRFRSALEASVLVLAVFTLVFFYHMVGMAVFY
jgi:hypothetical protein